MESMDGILNCGRCLEKYQQAFNQSLQVKNVGEKNLQTTVAERLLEMQTYVFLDLINDVAQMWREHKEVR